MLYQIIKEELPSLVTDPYSADEVAYYIGEGDFLACLVDGYISRIIPLDDWEMWNDEEFCLKAVRQNGWALHFVRNQTEEICLAAVVRRDYYVLDMVKNQTEEICLAAVREFGEALCYVKNQTEAICIEAVTNDGSTLRYVKKQTDDICLEAVKNNGYALRFVEKQTEEICLAAIRNEGFQLMYLVEPDIASRISELC